MRGSNSASYRLSRVRDWLPSGLREQPLVVWLVVDTRSRLSPPAGRIYRFSGLARQRTNSGAFNPR